jgi:long-chain acyl-CoA synthetase
LLSADDTDDIWEDGAPRNFSQLLDYSLRTYGDKPLFQQKMRREWQRYSAVDLHARAHTLAAGFASLGLRPHDRVAIILENGYDWVCAYYGIVLNGAIAVPIYYDLKPDEIEGMATHAEPTMAVVSPKVVSKLEGYLSRVKTVVVAGDAPAARGDNTRLTLEDVAACATEDSRREVASRMIDEDAPASIVFTSGTSGGNKGVVLTHRNFMANCQQVRRSIAFTERDRLVMVLPMHHAFPFIVTVAVAPAVGGEVTFENDLRRIRDRFAEVKPTLFMGVPALFEVMYRNIVHSIEAQGRLDTFEKGLRIVERTKRATGINIGRLVFRELHQRLGGSLRFMVSGGAALNPQVARNFARLGVPILQGWGLSEASPVLSAQRWHPRKFYTSNYYEERVGSIGEPLEGVEIALIDVPEKELYVHLHGEGELIARGENITPGYWRAPEESEEIKLGEWLRTGDIGRIDAEGNIWITGRSKFVIVLESGEKVYPDEVEDKVELSPLIQDVVVLGRKLRGKTQVTAVIYPNRDEVLRALDGREATEDAVREVIEATLRRQEQSLAGYKRVSEFQLTDEPLPRTPLRKVMRGRLRESYSFDPARWAETWAELPDDTGVSASTERELEEALSA